MTKDSDVIRRGLAEVWDTQGRKFVTFEATARPGVADAPWIQYLDGELNVDWPFDEDPAVALARRGVTLPRGAFASWHVPGSNAVFGVGDVRLDEVAEFIDALFGVIAVRGPRSVVTSRVEAHG